MNVLPFIAESALEAVTKIRAELGPEAVVVNVRQLPPDGLAKLWKKPRIEVLAYRPESPLPDASSAPNTPSAKPSALEGDALLELREEVRVLKQQMPSPQHATRNTQYATAEIRNPKAESRNSGWRVTEVLETSGLLPLHAERVLAAMQAKHGELPPLSLSEELVLARQTLLNMWPSLPTGGDSDDRPRLLIGPAGAGKTTCICKWLTQAKLVEGRSASVWRLDGMTANAAESLSVYCEILGVPCERTWNNADATAQADLSFLDLPGVDWRNPAALRELTRQVESFGPCRVHLVLNAAYEVPLLLAQARAFSALPVEDLILTHLDEEPRWGKIWNVVLGTNVPVRFFSAGQNIPGEFTPATAEKILQRQFPA